MLQLHTKYREAGGEDAVVKAEAGLLRRRGHDVEQYQARNPEGPIAAAAALTTSPWNPRAVQSVERVARRFKPDVAHVHNTWYALSPAAVRRLRRLGVPTVMTLHNYRLLCVNAVLFRDGRPCEDCVGTHPWRGVLHRCYRGSAAQSLPAAGTIALHRALDTWRGHIDLYLALSEFARERFLRGGLPPERVRVKSNFVADPGPRMMPAADSPTVLYVGRLSPAKGVPVLIDAWRQLGDTRLELVIVGDGPMRAELQRQAGRGVRFLGRQEPEEIRRLMLSARALALPSVLYEGQPLVALEAFAAGLPVLASDIGGLPEMSDGLGQEWLAAPGSRTQWSSRLRGLLDRGAIERASGQSRSTFERRYTEGDAGGALEEAFDWARQSLAATAGA